MPDDHEHKIPKNINLSKLIWSILINTVIVIFEMVYGLLIGSLALISDAFHNVADVASMILSYIGEKISAKAPNNKKTYGYKKTEAIIAFVNSSVLLAVIIFILFEAVKRLFNPVEINGLNMIIVASVAFVGNGVATLILQSSEKNLNMKSAWLHSLQDALFSLAVILASVLIYYFHWSIIDPLISIIISLFLIKEAYHITKESVDMLMDSVPSDIDFNEVKEELLKIQGIKQISDLHIWQANSKDKLLSAHLKISDLKNEDRNKLLLSIQHDLREKHKINHTTIQLVSINESEKDMFDCEHCN